MMIEPNKQEPAMKEMKVKVPQALLVKLHSLKILHGRQIGETVTEALDEYFATRDVPSIFGEDKAEV